MKNGEIEMFKNLNMSGETLKRYLVNLTMFMLLIGVTASSLYYLYVPGGFQGGRNPRFNMTIIFERETWEGIHVWTSIMLSVILLLHVFLHIQWIKSVFVKYIQIWKKSVRTGNWVRVFNVVDDGLSAVFFLVCLFSGLVLLFVPGGRGTDTTEILRIFRGDWKLIHTFSGIGMLIGIALHFIIHWKWIKKVSYKFFDSEIELFHRIGTDAISDVG